jgi:hypothetical protein
MIMGIRPQTLCVVHGARIAKTYWSERGAGARPRRNRDLVADSSIVVQVEPGSKNFTVTYGANKQDTYRTWP